MRSMMLSILLLTGCACCKKQADCPVIPNGTIIYPGPKRIVETLPPPELYQEKDLPPAGPPIPLNSVPATPTGRVKVIEVNPIHIYPPLPPDVPEWQDPKIIIPKEGNPVLRTKVQTNCKFIMTENPPYNGPPSVGWELCWKW